MNELVQQTLNHQLEIDAIYFAHRYMSSNWEVLQNLYLKRLDYNEKLTDWSTKAIKAIWNFSSTLWKSRCEFVHRTNSKTQQSARRKELLSLISKELDRTQAHMDHSTRQLRYNMKKSIAGYVTQCERRNVSEKTI